tara:strand:+ start:359 stop:547 length:189 start_codon:yes stop_codon:yes gene_type:complete
MDNCTKCNSKLNGKMVFFPELCLSCVIDLHCKGKLDESPSEVKKAFDKQKDFLNHKIIAEKA